MVSGNNSLLKEVRETLQSKSDKNNIHFFVTTCSENARGVVWQATGYRFEKAWLKVERYLNEFDKFPKWLKIELVDTSEAVSADEGIAAFYQTQRNNYFRYGVKFKKDNTYTFLPEEIVGNSLLVPPDVHVVGKRDARLKISEDNFSQYIASRDQKTCLKLVSHFDSQWRFFTKKGIFIEDGIIYPLENEAYGQGVRRIDTENQWLMLKQGIERGANYLVDQVTNTGKFIYGYFPVYGRKINSYNSVRHYSSLYALLEAYEYLKEQGKAGDDFLQKIEQGLQWGLMNLTQVTEDCYYVVERLKSGVELKLGAQAMVILALTKYQTVTGNQQFLPSIKKFLAGMKSFIAADGATTHVLNEDLTEKEAFRIIYYDGEALFAIMRAYPLVKRKEWLELAERLMNHFIVKKYERYHDHWLSYSVNELTKYVPRRKYFEFGVRNALDNLSFIENRDTAYPTMLELLVAAVKMFDRIEEIGFKETLFTEEEFFHLKQVMEKRAIHELRTGTMWPELAMFFVKPETIAGGFYVRHDRCRMRIDDAEHFLSGLINYQEYMQPDTVIEDRPRALEMDEADVEDSIDISVLIPVYNREKEIADCLNKLARSTFDKARFEVIVADDASTDNTVKAIQSFEDQFEHLKIVCLPENSGGASVPRNMALKQAKGKWVMFVDSDDYITPFALEGSYQLAIKDEETDLVGMPYFRAEGSKRALGRSCFSSPTAVTGLDFLDTKLYNSLNIVGKLIRKEVLDKYPIEFPLGIKVREDNWFSMKLYAVVRKVALLGNKKSYYFCGDRDGVSLSRTGTPPRDAMKIYSEVFRFIFELEELSQDRKADILAIYMNRYAGMIRRGRYSPERLFNRIGHSLYLVKKSRYLDPMPKQFIEDLYSGKYERQ
ncbi:glycosyltransferase family 2 protein [Enterococcus sp. 669A]|uniref:Glycosyltransferase family 2 protein n=1 Tax=Candidatus Enterococcus moelleringii TaxID=2815325 RepID=A0ABS3L8E3_9ENTE|nr:glycosyltransferase family 2 protein [Enterococcus sp. 669A]MBO1305893.1 glycosyltransferase family 2 protein [Enterococcus sp. 669A]